MYQQETFPENIRFVRDNPYNRIYLIEKLGKPKFLIESESAYIEIDMNTKTWKNTYSFQWLYRNPPPLTNIEKIEI